MCWLQLAVSKGTGPGHLCVRLTLHSVCRNGLASDTSFPYLRISFREGNNERQKVPEAVCSTGSLVFWLHIQSENLCELPSVEGMLALMGPAPAPRQGGCSPAPFHSAALGVSSCPVAPHSRHSWLGDTVICHPRCGARPPTARAWESSQDNYSWPV